MATIEFLCASSPTNSVLSMEGLREEERRRSLSTFRPAIGRKDTSHQRYWAHLLRVAKAGAEESGKGRTLYTKLCRLYEHLTKDLEEASPRARARRLHLGKRKLARLVERFGRSGVEGVRKVVTYLENGMPWWLTFLKRPGVEPTNHRGERSIREAVILRKILGTLRNEKGANALARLLSVSGTWRLRGEDPAKNLYTVLS